MAPRLAAWVEKISEDNKKGLRVLHKILEVDGKKRFKKDESSATTKAGFVAKDVYAVPFEEA